MEMNKKYLIIAISSVVILGAGVFIFTRNGKALNSSLDAKNGDLVLQNIAKANIKISTDDSSEKIQINLIGPADELKKVYFNKSPDGLSEFSLPENSNGVRGTIVIPKGVRIVDMDLPPGVDYVVDQPSDAQNQVTSQGKNLWNSRGGGNIGNTKLPSGLSGNNGNPQGNNGNLPGDNGQGNVPGDNGSGNVPGNNGNGGNNGNNNGQNPPPNNPNNPNPPAPPNNPNNPNPPNTPNTPPNTPVCGNGILETGEQCDDGNNVSGDGCSSGCTREYPLSTCGNLLLEPGEQCDDGNRVSGDGCSSTCQLELSSGICGNGILEAGEQCDDGNRVSGDGCSSICNLENVQYTECTIQLKQEERNQCCQEVNINSPHEECTGYWLFDYNSRLCYWHCPPKNCSVPSTPVLKNSCCANENKDKPTPPCAGDWIFDATKNMCSFACTDFASNGEHTQQQIDQTTQYCKNTYTDQNDIDKCCDDFLKHPLSLGPHPGYPDCIGKWSIKPGTSTCQFDCVSYEEMTDILNGLKANNGQ
jgi:cysteine-rich repeat protein